MSAPKTFKTLAYAMPNAALRALRRDLAAAGYRVVADRDAGTVEAFASSPVAGEPELKILVALQLGTGRHWLVRADPRAVRPAGREEAPR